MKKKKGEVEGKYDCELKAKGMETNIEVEAKGEVNGNELKIYFEKAKQAEGLSAMPVGELMITLTETKGNVATECTKIFYNPESWVWQRLSFVKAMY